MLNRNWMREFDYFLFLLTLTIFLLGMIFLYSASYFQFRDIPLRQLCWMGVSLLLLIMVLIVGVRKLLNLSYFIYGFNLILLGLVFAIGYHAGGAYRWLRFGHSSLGFQPSELAKVTLIIMLAHFLGHRDPRRNEIGTILGSCLFWLFPFVLIALQPDLGTALTLTVILAVMLFYWGMKVTFFLAIMGAGIAFSPLLWHLLKDYQKARLLVFFNPELGDAYTVIQSRITIGSGRLLGKGFLEGTQNRLGFLPGRHTDFIFSVVGEEWGLLGAVLLIILYWLLLYRCLSTVEVTGDKSSQLVVIGVAAMIGFHVLVNLAMTIGIMPVVGLPLPWVSYGGSNLLANMVSIGLVLAVKMERTIF